MSDSRLQLAADTALEALPRTEETAREMLERARWPDGASCPHCDAADAYRLTPGPGSTTGSDRWKCRTCRRQFTVSFGTILQASRLKRTVWLKAIYLLCCSGRAVSVHQLHELLGIHYDSAASVAQRVRYALEQARPRLVRPVGAGAALPGHVAWPSPHEQAARFILACRPAVHFAGTLESILAVRPQRASRRSASFRSATPVVSHDGR